jgi:RHS repeat-associated protein
MFSRILVMVVGVFYVAAMGTAHAVTTSGVGSTAGKFDVGSNGAATYTVPLQVPPGINGMEPKLALTYNSQGGNGLLGVGWSLAGVSAISRCPGTIAVDGKRSGIDFSAERFCLNGQRLIYIGAASDGGREYNTEIENFLRIRAYGATASNPDYFKVWAKDGAIQSFGNISSTGTDARFKPGAGNALLWPAVRTEDTYGNYISYTYTTSATEQYLSRIDYADKSGTATRSIVFGMDTTTRSDVITAYVAGKQVSTTQRIKTITTQLGGGTVRTYTLGYENESSGAARSRLNNITEAGADGVSYATPLSFIWRSDGAQSVSADASSLTVNGGATGLGQWTQAVDFNDDGRADVFKVHDTASGYVTVSLNSANGWTDKVTGTTVITAPTTTNGGLNDWNELADVNGDGIIDIFRVVNPTDSITRTIKIYLGQEDGAFNTASPVSVSASAINYVIGYGFRHDNQLIDMNGDGLMDIIRVVGTSFYVSYGYLDNNGAYGVAVCGDATCTFGGLANSNDVAHGFRQTNQFADMNGDGIVDVFRVSSAAFGQDPLNAKYASVLFGVATPDSSAINKIPGGKLAYSASGLQADVVVPILFSDKQYGGYFTYYNQLVDVNGDGITDVAGAYYQGTQTQFLFSLYKGPNDKWGNTITEAGCTGPNSFGQQMPCNKYFANAQIGQFSNALVIRLGKGDGSFEVTPRISAGVVNTSGLGFGAQTATDQMISAFKAGVLASGPNCGSPSSSSVMEGSIKVNVFSYPSCTTTLGENASKGFSQWNQFADVNGDGFADVVSAYGGAVYVNLGKGDGSYQQPMVQWAAATVETTKPTAGAASFNAWSQLADLNGDGIVDLFRVTATSSTAQRYLSNRAVPSLVETVKDGVGLSTTVTYAPLTDASVYTRTGVLDTYPSRKMLSPSYVVKRVTANGGDFTYTHEYGYKNARVNMWRGWLGFEEMTAIDTSVVPNRKSITTFRYDFPYTGLVSEAKTQLGADSLFVSRVTNTWNKRTSTSSSGQTHYRYLDDTAEQAFEPSNNYVQAYKKVTDYQDNVITGNFDALPYDQYGNPEKVVVTHYNANNTLEHTTETQYLSNYLGNNFRGQLSDQTVTTTHTPAGQTARTRVAQTTFNTNFQLSSVTTQPGDGLALTASYGYDPTYGVPSSETQQGSDATYDASGTVANAPVSRSASYVYSGWGISTDPLVVTKTSTVGGSKAPLVETTKYNKKFGVKIEYKDPAGVITQWNPDGFGRLVEELHNVGTTAAFTVAKAYAACAADCANSVKYAATVTTQSGTIALTGAVTTQYDALGRERRNVADGLAGKKIYRDTQYDTAGREWKKSRPYFAGASTYWQQTDYDTAGRVSKVTEPNGAYTQYAYDRLQTTATKISTDEPAKATVYSKDSKGQIIAVKDANNKTTTYSYGAFGVLEKIADPKTNEIKFSYDIFGNKLSQTDPDLGAWQYRYNAFGDLKWQKDARGEILRYGYDLVGRTVSRIEGMNATDPATAWDYDTARVGAGRLDNTKRSTTSVDSVAKSYNYDLAGRVNAVNTILTQAGVATSYVFNTNKDSLGRLTDLTYPGAVLKTRYKYYPSGLLDRVVKLDATGAETATVYWNGQDYNAEDQVTSESWYNGLPGSLAGTRAYYPDNGAINFIVAGYAGSNIQNWSYDYYKSGNLKSQTNVTQGNATESFYYDVLDRLKLMQSSSAALQNFDYDELGNTAYKTGVGFFSYSTTTTRPHAVTAIAPATATASLPGDANNNKSYDVGDLTTLVTNSLNGAAATTLTDCTRDNLTNVLDILCVNSRIADPVTTVNYSYLYDANGNLQSGAGRSLTFNRFNMPQTVTLGSQVTTFGYGPGLERLSKTVANGAASETTLYIEGLYEKRTSGAITTQRYYVPAGDRLVAVAVDTGAGPVNYSIHTDRLGSMDVIANSARLAVNDLRFDAWGLRTDGTAAASLLTTRGYTGHELDSDSGLVNMNARLYDPLLGRFVSADTVLPDPSDLQSLNRYSYALNNPFRYVDFDGHEPAIPTLSPIDVSIIYSPSMPAPGVPADIASNAFGGFQTVVFWNNPGTGQAQWTYLPSNQNLPTYSPNTFNGVGQDFGSSLSFGGGAPSPMDMAILSNIESRRGGAQQTTSSGVVGAAADIGVGFTPAGVYADVYSAITGRTLFGDQELSLPERALGLVPGVSEIFAGVRIVRGVSDVANNTGKKYVTYTADDLDNPGKIYTGRCSGTCDMTPQQILDRRKAGHHRNLGDLQLDQVTDSYPAIRGREQQVLESLRQQGLATDQINGVGPRNKNNKDFYMDAAKKAFGE